MPNMFEDFWARGFHRLVPIIPPDAPVHPKSRIAKRIAARPEADPRGKVPGVLEGETWHGIDLVRMESQPEDLPIWHAMGASIGIKLGQGLIALDVDTMHRPTAEAIYRIANTHLGNPQFVRFGSAPKCLFLYRTEDDIGYRQVRFSTPDEERAHVEILSEGRQFVAHGVHPKTGKPYSWKGDLPVYDRLTSISADALETFLRACETELPDAAIQKAATAADAPDQDELRAPSWEALRAVVDGMPNNSAMFPARNDYVQVAYAIRGATPAGYELEAADLYLSWCERWEDGSNDMREALEDWNRAKPPVRIGYSWLQERAINLYFQPVDPDGGMADVDMFAANAEASGELDRYEVLSIHDLYHLPDPHFLLDRHIPEGAFGFLYGDPGCGKSFVALDWALHMACGLPDYHGDAIRTRPEASVLYLAKEGASGFKARIAAWMQDRLLPVDAEPRFKLIRQTINFMRADDIIKLLRTVKSLDTGPIDLIVVDTVSRAMPGADENLQKEMTLFVKACDALKDATGASVLGVHHAGKSGDMRGSSVLRGAGDFVFRLARKKGADRAYLTCEKQKDAEDQWTEAYALRKVSYEHAEAGHGQSLVPQRLEANEAEETKLTSDLQTRILSAVQAAWEAGEPWSKAARARERYAVRRMVSEFDIAGDVAETWLAMWLDLGVLEERVKDARRHLKGLVCTTDAEVVEMGIFD